jgi:hypothetical protein
MPWASNSYLIKVYLILYLAIIEGSSILKSFSVAISLRASSSSGVMKFDRDLCLRGQYFFMGRT